MHWYKIGSPALPGFPFGDAQLLLTAPVQKEGFLCTHREVTSPELPTCFRIPGYLPVCSLGANNWCKATTQHVMDCLLWDCEKKMRFPDRMSLGRSSSAEGDSSIIEFETVWSYPSGNIKKARQLGIEDWSSGVREGWRGERRGRFELDELIGGWSVEVARW